MKINYTIYLLILTSNMGFAQNSIVPSGSYMKTENGSISLSVGQLSNASVKNSYGGLVEGNQQTFNIKENYVDEPQKNKFKVYPNPTSDYLLLDVNEAKKEELIYQLYDYQGKLLTVSEIRENEVKINFKNYPSGKYLLTLLTKNKILGSFDIIKK